MIRNETFQNGICLFADIYDLDTHRYQREEAGVIVAERAMTDAEVLQYGPQPLDTNGVFATLNAVLGVWPLQDAANAVGLTEQDLINEAEAWAVGS
jgi:hypothetical protein